MSVKTHVYSPRSLNTAIEFIKKYGEEVSPRGVDTYEMVNASLLIRNPINRVATDRGRKMNIAFGVMEWFAMVLGIDDLNSFTAFIKSYDNWSSDGIRVDGAYGTRVNFRYASPLDHDMELIGDMPGSYNHGTIFNQISGIISEFMRDIYTRRAVMSIYRSEDLFGQGGKNTPCTLTLQFLVRNSKLHMIVNMRSSDIIKGVTYDVFAFSMIQEFITRHLQHLGHEVELGEYWHNAGSLHFYKSDEPLLEKMEGNSRWPYIMKPMPYIGFEDLYLVGTILKAWRDGGELVSPVYQIFEASPKREYIIDLLAVMEMFLHRKTDPVKTKALYENISCQTLKFVSNSWLTS